MGDDGYSRYNFGGMTAGESNFVAAANALMQELDDLEGKLKGKLSRWDDDAQQSYWRFQKEWHAGAMDMQKVVTALGGAIGTANQNAAQAVRSGVTIWDG